MFRFFGGAVRPDKVAGGVIGHGEADDARHSRGGILQGLRYSRCRGPFAIRQ